MKLKPEDYKGWEQYTQIHKGPLSHEGGVRLLSAVLLMTKMYAEEVGEEKAFDLFQRWAAVFNMSGVRYVMERDGITGRTPLDFIKTMGQWDEEIGDRWEIIEESPDKIRHYIHNCIYRDACERVGIDISRWGTCERSIPETCNPIASALSPDLTWQPLGCQDKPGSCLFEIFYTKKA
ncbi:MAG TPA: hypothetical protein PKM59_10740 [Thermodesulfobacteriota bacterium]|nr:hypothetical protein [Thermodesulfobacteriota bacterium]